MFDHYECFYSSRIWSLQMLTYSESFCSNNINPDLLHSYCKIILYTLFLEAQSSEEKEEEMGTTKPATNGLRHGTSVFLRNIA